MQQQQKIHIRILEISEASCWRELLKFLTPMSFVENWPDSKEALSAVKMFTIILLLHFHPSTYCGKELWMNNKMATSSKKLTRRVNEVHPMELFVVVCRWSHGKWRSLGGGRGLEAWFHRPTSHFEGLASCPPPYYTASFLCGFWRSFASSSPSHSVHSEQFLVNFFFMFAQHSPLSFFSRVLRLIFCHVWLTICWNLTSHIGSPKGLVGPHQRRGLAIFGPFRGEAAKQFDLKMWFAQPSPLGGAWTPWVVGDPLPPVLRKFLALDNFGIQCSLLQPTLSRDPALIK